MSHGGFKKMHNQELSTIELFNRFQCNHSHSVPCVSELFKIFSRLIGAGSWFSWVIFISYISYIYFFSLFENLLSTGFLAFCIVARRQYIFYYTSSLTSETNIPNNVSDMVMQDLEFEIFMIIDSIFKLSIILDILMIPF